MTDKRVPAEFYRNENGTEPVRDWLKSLSKEERFLIGADIKTVEFGWPIGMPTCRPMGDGLFEVRTNLPQNKIARVLFCFYEGKMILLHGFIKKSQKTPKQQLNLAWERKHTLEA
ncbi:type II toxin-antitoxin system RelE/ParE family toxin [Dolichospermum circinale CS-1225]|jgi:phage-related protein|uniref:type II toxin-antitoxin system RelE/ParE family toxin n=1 Tax=Dolichospermum circinale TaxID=109265 RepID=UPI00232CE475|nr:type II toxin-antitoxin system RelE/ParE family toxin [Dolichospermum circinale]MDB9459553.1 type II toxin-antitoxin system RelE/ParE family toxin [Dolichospermum circinale CS-545/17]MDB9453148.1 type II toxin-antitoxin system RelE/ParE family toxin [Dolichospermum circinale CS-541/06]MDB9464577.1 type II toxin-antitoxin system RelE/ParE family toxin [Dolichospermum circinale CS-541/04]MDB9490859.1 type II toxin-antitoxin system RelE/ParE family toxin [Dolichospermum circinale CS-534/05]MDB